MKIRNSRILVNSFTRLVMIVALFGVFSPVQAVNPPGTNPLGDTSYVAYLELSMDPPFAAVGSLVTLHITYYNLGEPYAYINIIPEDLVAFDPPMTSPCKYYEHPDGCQSITFRALANGVVNFYVGATGEVWDEDCHCWYWGGGTSSTPARLVITDHVWHSFLPAVYHNA